MFIKLYIYSFADSIVRTCVNLNSHQFEPIHAQLKHHSHYIKLQLKSVYPSKLLRAWAQAVAQFRYDPPLLLTARTTATLSWQGQKSYIYKYIEREREREQVLILPSYEYNWCLIQHYNLQPSHYQEQLLNFYFLVSPFS